MKKIFFLFSLLIPATAFAQGDTLMLPKLDNVKEYTSATFKSTRIVNFQSVEVCRKRELEFMIQHRFGEVNGGANSFWGLDNGSSIRLGLGYSYDGRLEIGIGRTSYEKMVDGYIKYRWLRQTVDGGMPVSLTLYGGAFCTTQQDPNASLNGYNEYHYMVDRLSYCFQPILARKFSKKLSLQFSPTYIHYNVAIKITDKNDVLAFGFAGRYKFNKRMAVTAEYGLKYNSYTAQKYYNTIGLGWDIETGGHVFQMILTNSTGIVEPQFIPHTTSTWQNGGFRIGFNISRAFNI